VPHSRYDEDVVRERILKDTKKNNDIMVGLKRKSQSLDGKMKGAEECG
jgi:hypothetical protein